MGHTPGGDGVADRVADRLAAAARFVRQARVADVRAGVDAARAVAGGALGRDDAVFAGTLIASAYLNAEDLPNAKRELDAVAPLLPDAGLVRQARYHAVAGLLAHQNGDDEQAISALIGALASLDADLPATEELASVLGNCSIALARTQLFTLGVETGERAIAVAAAAGIPRGRFQLQVGYGYLTWAIRLEHLGLAEEAEERWRGAAEHFVPALDWTDDLGPLFAANAHVSLAMCQARLGWPGDGRHSLDVARAIKAEQVPDLVQLLTHVEGAVLLAEGRHETATALLRRFWTDVRDRHHRQPWTEDVAYMLGRAAETAGDGAEALGWYAEVHRRYGRAEYEIALARASAARLRVEQEALLRRSQQLESDARSDPLTGAANRRALDETLLRRIVDHQAAGSPTTLVVVDIDHFKQINDDRGHLVGDEVLRQVATLLRAQVHDGDLCARYGGDEFVLVLTATAAEAADVARRAAAAVAGYPWSTVAAGLAITVTCGLAQQTAEHTPSSLFAAADADLLRAKRARYVPVTPEAVPTN